MQHCFISDPDSTREWTTLSPTGIASLTRGFKATRQIRRATCNVTWRRTKKPKADWNIGGPATKSLGLFYISCTRNQDVLKLKEKKYGTHIVLTIKLVGESLSAKCLRKYHHAPYKLWGRSRPKVSFTPLRVYTAAHRKQFIQFVLLNLLLWLCDLLMFVVLHPACFCSQTARKTPCEFWAKCIGQESTYQQGRSLKFQLLDKCKSCSIYIYIIYIYICTHTEGLGEKYQNKLVGSHLNEVVL